MTAVAVQILDFLTAELDRSGRSAALTAHAPLLESGVLDSVTLMGLIAFLEDRFAIALDPEQIVPEHFDTVEAIAALVGANGPGA
jgi:acyl carrier protein